MAGHNEGGGGHIHYDDEVSWWWQILSKSQYLCLGEEKMCMLWV